MILAKERYRNHPFFISFIRYFDVFCEGANDIFQVSSNGTLNREAKTSVIILHVHSCKERQPISHPYFGSIFKKMKHCERRIFHTISSFVPAHKNTASNFHREITPKRATRHNRFPVPNAFLFSPMFKYQFQWCSILSDTTCSTIFTRCSFPCFVYTYFLEHNRLTLSDSHPKIFMQSFDKTRFKKFATICIFILKTKVSALPH